MRDHMEFVPRVAWLMRAFVRRDVTRIFDYRQRTLVRLFDDAAR